MDQQENEYMTADEDRVIRMECLRLAVECHSKVPYSNVVELAQQMLDFARGSGPLIDNQLAVQEYLEARARADERGMRSEFLMAAGDMIRGGLPLDMAEVERRAEAIVINDPDRPR